MSMKTAIVTTAINFPKHLESLMFNLTKYNHDVEYIFIGDNKTPSVAITALNSYPNVTALSIAKQKEWIKEHGEKYLNIFKENNYQRRVIGFLIAAQNQVENIIILDDDNYLNPDEDFINHHEVGHISRGTSASSNVGYVNQCDFLALNEKVFTRGFPSDLTCGKINYEFIPEEKRVVSNIGLWSKSPDVRAKDHIIFPELNVEEFRLRKLMVARGNYISYTVQNTSFHIDTLPAQYEFPMGEYIESTGEYKIGRYDDILQGLLLERVVSAMDDRISFGPPQAIHNRHLHNYGQDVVEEIFGDILVRELLSYLKKIEIDGDDYYSLTSNLIEKLKTHVFPFNGYFQKVMDNYTLWLELIDKVKN